MDNTGKGIPPAGGWYGTGLAPEQEAAYRLWVTTLPERLRSDYDYDLRGAWLAGDRPDGEGHMTDRWKKPWHPTFSEESVYSRPGVQGGRWEGETFVPSAYNKWVRAFTGANEGKCGGELKKCGGELKKCGGKLYAEGGGKLYAEGGGIHIKKENRGKFTAAADRAGMGVQAYARHVLANKGSYSPTLVKRANFARNAAKWHADGGNLFLVGGEPESPWHPPKSTYRINGTQPAGTAMANPYAERKSQPVAWSGLMNQMHTSLVGETGRYVPMGEPQTPSYFKYVNQNEYPYGKIPENIQENGFRDMLNDYIHSIENPYDIGYNKEIDAWFAPEGKQYDKNQRGYGIDLNTNKAIQPFIQEDSSGNKYIYNSDMLKARDTMIDWILNKNMKDNYEYIRKTEGFVPDVSDKKKAAVAGYAYQHGNMRNLIDKNRHPALYNAYVYGTDDEFLYLLHKQYEKEGYGERAKNSSEFFKR